MRNTQNETHQGKTAVIINKREITNIPKMSKFVASIKYYRRFIGKMPVDLVDAENSASC